MDEINAASMDFFSVSIYNIESIWVLLLLFEDGVIIELSLVPKISYEFFSGPETRIILDWYNSSQCIYFSVICISKHIGSHVSPIGRKVMSWHDISKYLHHCFFTFPRQSQMEKHVKCVLCECQNWCMVCCTVNILINFGPFSVLLSWNAVQEGS